MKLGIVGLRVIRIVRGGMVQWIEQGLESDN